MYPSKALALLAILTVLGSILGAVVRLPAVLADGRATLVLGLVVVVVGFVAGMTALSRRWRTNPYW